MKKNNGMLLCGTALAVAGLAGIPAARAQSQAAQTAATPDPALSPLDAIIVTARRQSENVQSVPVSIQVVSGDTIKKLSITHAEDISKLTPGLTLTSQNTGTGQITLRGVTWTEGSGTEAIPVYFNDIPFQPSAIVQSLYDIGQIEVLRGPQGTTRGAPSISGAVTITTKAPDLTQVGGYVFGQVGSHDHQSGQFAFNVPIIADKLAIRVAGLVDQSQANDVKSLHNAADPSLQTRSIRVSALFKPTDRLTISASFQALTNTGTAYTQVAGPGSAGVPALGIAANYNGPALSASDYAAVQSVGNQFGETYHHLTVNVGWDVLGQRLTYNYGLQKTISGNLYNSDPGGMLPGYGVPQSGVAAPGNYYNVHELRLSSIRAPGRFFDYDIGYFRNREFALESQTNDVYLQGAFGLPGGAVPGTPLPRYTLPIHDSIGVGIHNESFYGNVQLHLPGAIEFSGGLRYIKDQRPADISVANGAAYAEAAPNFYFGGTCPAAFGLVNSAYAGYCDSPIPAGATINTTQSFNPGYKPVIWNASLSHKFTPDIMGYATVGTSWRQGLPALGTFGLPDSLIETKPERATSYEVGFKSTIARIIHFNVDVFQINYKNQLTSLGGVQYFNPTSGSVSATSVAFFGNLDARVRGAEGEFSIQPTRNLSFGVNVSYSKITSRGGTLPCNGNVANLSATNLFNYCSYAAGQVLNQTAPFQSTINGSYSVPMGPFDGYVRFNVNWQGNNPNFGTSAPARNATDPSALTPTPSYALVDLFAGLNSGRQGWDVGLYVKNAFNKRQELTSEPISGIAYVPNPGSTGFGSPGYDQITTTLPREIGVTLRFAFGSR